MDEMGIWDRYGVKILGTPIDTLRRSEDRELFAKALKQVKPHSNFVMTHTMLLNKTNRLIFQLPNRLQPILLMKPLLLLPVLDTL